MTIETLTQHPEGARYTVRSLGSSDYAHLRRLEEEIWSGDGAGELCPHYLRLCTELYRDWCFLALDGDRPVGYVLNFVKGTTVYCATLAVHPEYQKGRLISTYAADLQANKCLHEYYHGDTGQPLSKPEFLSWNLLAARISKDLESGVNPLSIDAV